MISDTARHKLLVLSGQCSENTGELILQSGAFSFFKFIDIFTDQEVSHHDNYTTYDKYDVVMKNKSIRFGGFCFTKPFL